MPGALDCLLDGNKLDMAGFDLGKAAIDLSGPSLLDLTWRAQTCQQVVCQQGALFGRQLECFSFERGELREHE
jgi:hypothetical protein